MFQGSAPIISSLAWTGPEAVISRVAHVATTSGTEYLYYLQLVTTAGLTNEVRMYRMPSDLSAAATEVDAAGNPTTLNHVYRNHIDSEMDANGLIHIALGDNNAGVGGVKYITFNTVTGLWGGLETASATVPPAATDHISITVDSSNIPHIVWGGLHTDAADKNIRYTNRIGGTWAATTTVGVLKDAPDRLALRYANGYLGLFYVLTATTKVYMIARGTGATDTWGTAYNITQATAPDGSDGYTTIHGSGLAGSFFNVAASDAAWHVIGYDWGDVTCRLTYTEIPAKATLQCENTEYDVIHIDHWRDWGDVSISNLQGLRPPGLVVSDDGEQVIVLHYFTGTSKTGIYQRTRQARASGFEIGNSYPVFESTSLSAYAILTYPHITSSGYGYAVMNNSHSDIIALRVDASRSPEAGVTHDIVIDGKGYMLAGPMSKVDITSSIPRISIATEQKKDWDFSELDTFGQFTFHQGRGERYLMNPQAFQDSDNVLTHIPNQVTLALASTTTTKTVGGASDFGGKVARFGVYAGNWYALVAGTAAAQNALWVWNNAGSGSWDAVVAGLDTTSGVPYDLANHKNNFYVSQGEAVNMRFYDGTAASWKDAGVKRKCLAVWDNKLWGTFNLNELYYSSNPEAAVPTWTLLGTVRDADSFITRMVVYQDALIIFKEDCVFAVERDGAGSYTMRELVDETYYRDTQNGMGGYADKGILYWNRKEQVNHFDGANTRPIGPERGADTLGSNFKGLPADEDGEFRSFCSDGAFLYGAITPNANTAYPQVMVFNGIGWSSFWKGSTLNNAINQVSHLPIRTTTGVLAYPTLWFDDGGTIKYIKLPRTSYNPLDDTSLSYVTSGFFDTAIYDGGLPLVSKVFGEILVGQRLNSSFTGYIGVSMKINELDATSMATTAHNIDAATDWWQLKPANAAFASETVRYSIGEASDPDSHTIFGGIHGGAPVADKIQLRVRLAGAGGAGKTPIVTSYAYRFITKPKPRFGWTVPLRIYETVTDLDDRITDTTAAERRAALYAARDAMTPVLFFDGESPHKDIANQLLDPAFRVGGFTTAIGTVAENKFCTLHTHLGKKSQFIYITNTADAGVYVNVVHPPSDPEASVYGSVYVLNWGPTPVHLQLRNDTTVVEETTIYPKPEWQLAEVRYTHGVSSWADSGANFNLAVIRKASFYSARFHLAAAQLIVGTTEPGSYLDGDQPRCYWVDTPNTIKSVRRAGMRVYVTGINEVYRFRKIGDDEIRRESEITLQLREVL